MPRVVAKMALRPSYRKDRAVALMPPRPPYPEAEIEKVTGVGADCEKGGVAATDPCRGTPNDNAWALPCEWWDPTRVVVGGNERNNAVYTFKVAGIYNLKTKYSGSAPPAQAQQTQYYNGKFEKDKERKEKEKKKS